ncbi:hypothetical protein WH5701_03154 [Synechococcus sp. WH 5701]|nr:hypothetical protein WH5701_03154 [Synechococcus sp. WH 5701]
MAEQTQLFLHLIAVTTANLL